jgi:hypothetical protein
MRQLYIVILLAGAAMAQPDRSHVTPSTVTKEPDGTWGYVERTADPIGGQPIRYLCYPDWWVWFWALGVRG